MYIPELLAPAGNLEKLKIAIMYGANAVYLGGKKYSLRSSASNFEISDIKEGVEFAKKYNAKVYVVVNMIFHDEDFEGLIEYLKQLEEIEVTGVICADIKVVSILQLHTPKLEVHISTQQSITNEYALKFYEDLNVDRIVLAREVSYEQLAQISSKSKVELEYFVHGAMCVAYSGRCMLSNYYSRRDSNRGGCSQSCRWDYELLQENNDGFDKIRDLDDDFFTMSSTDLSLINSIPKLIDLEIASFKIEGRMKSIYYLATIISAYRKIIDDYMSNKDDFKLDSKYEIELSKAANRLTNVGFFNNEVDESFQIYGNRNEHPTKEFIGYVLDYEENLQLLKIEQRNYFEVNDMIEIFSPNKLSYRLKVEKMFDENMDELDVARHPKQIVYIKCLEKISKHSMIRKVE